MYRHHIASAVVALLVGIVATQSASAFTLGYSRGVQRGLESIKSETSTLAPFVHTRSCVGHADDLVFN